MIISPKVKPIFFWSQKVLPLVYDNSLSYYEVLGKVVEKMNELVTAINDHIKEFIVENADELLTEVMYDSTTETITFVERSEL